MMLNALYKGKLIFKFYKICKGLKTIDIGIYKQN